MKTMILQVERYDNAVSIRDKIAWCNSQRILLVLPRKKKIHLGIIDIELIDRTAREKGAKLAIVTRDGKTRDFARSLGVYTYRSIPEAERASWEGTKKSIDVPVATKKGIVFLREIRSTLPDESTERQVSKPIKLGFLATLVLIVLFLVFIVSPSANITVYPSSQKQEIDVTVHASTDVDRMNIAGFIPAVNRTVTLTGKKSAYSSGSVSIGETKAKGEVSVSNLTQSTVFLPAGTIFSTSSTPAIRFTNLYGKNIPAGEVPAMLSVLAVLPGVESNVAAAQISVIEGINGALLAVTNTEPFTGGTLQVFPAPTQYDYVSLRNKLLKEMADQVLTNEELSQKDGWLPIKESIKLDEVTQETRGNLPREASDILSMEINAKYSILFYNPVDVDQLVAEVAEISIPEGYHLASAGTNLTGSGKVTLSENGEATWSVKAQNQIIKNYPTDTIKKMIKGKTRSNAILILNQEIPHYQSSGVNTAKWWPWLPVFVSQIQMNEVTYGGG